MEVRYRHATDADIERITTIYNTVIVDSHVSFDTEPQTVAQRRSWFADKTVDGYHQAWVAESEGEVLGVAYSGPWRPKTAYEQTVETTIVLDPDAKGKGVGTGLLTALLDALATAGVHRAIAIVALPNEASVRLHHRVGFRTVGVLDDVGFKMGKWWSTELLEKAL